MNQLRSFEKEIFLRWESDIFGPDVEKYLVEARQDLMRSGRGVKDQSVREGVAGATVLLLADHMLLSETQDALRKILPAKRSRKERTVVITDRLTVRFQPRLKNSENISEKEWMRALGLDGKGLGPGIPKFVKECLRRRYEFVCVKRQQTLEESDESLVREVLRAEKGGNRVIVWTGLARIVPSHLPRSLSKSGLECIAVSVDGGASRIYQAVATDWIKLGSGVYLDQTRSPVYTLERERVFQESLEAVEYAKDLENVFKKYCTKLKKTLDLPEIPKTRKLLNPFSLNGLKEILSTAWSAREREFVLERIRNGESAVLPGKASVLLCSLDRGEIAEEASHHMHVVGRPHIQRPEFVVIEEAFGFFGSKLCVPSRKLPDPKAEAVTEWGALHEEGYRVGKLLFEKWNRARSYRRQIRNFWLRVPKTESDVIDLEEEMKRFVGQSR